MIARAATIAVRRATRADLPAIMTIMEDAFDARWGETWNDDQVAGAIGSTSIGALACDAGEPIGFSLLRVVADEAELLLVAVRPASRGRGAGLALVQGAVAAARVGGARTLFLEVRDGNEAAVALYARAGFVAVGRRRGYYTGRDQLRYDAITMRFHL